MLIGVDGTCWTNERGFGRFTREVCRALAEVATQHELVFFLDPASAERFDVHRTNVRARTVHQSVAPTKAASASTNRSFRDMLRLTSAVQSEKPEVFFAPAVYSYFPLPLGTRAVITLHDAIAESFPHLTFASQRARFLWNLKVRVAVFQSRLILTVSDYAAQQIHSRLGIPLSQLRVCREAPAPAFVPRGMDEVRTVEKSLGIPEHVPYFVYVGGFNPHKNVRVLVDAHARVAARYPEVHLLLAGPMDTDSFHEHRDDVMADIERLGTHSLVRLLGFLPDYELSALQSRAVALILPSESEGFGLPAVEAAACGCPVIATTESPLPDILAGGGMFVPPGDADSLGAAMTYLLSEPKTRNELAAVARKRAAALSWTDSARAVLAALEEARSIP